MNDFFVNAEDADKYAISAKLRLRYQVREDEIRRLNPGKSDAILSLVADRIKPRIKTEGEYPDAGIDLFSCEERRLMPGEMGVISSGISFELFPWQVGLIFPRGGDRFLVGSGVIDSGYRGVVKTRVYNWTDDVMMFEIGSSIGQMVVTNSQMIDVDLMEVESLQSDTDRGEDGRINNV